MGLHGAKIMSNTANQFIHSDNARIRLKSCVCWFFLHVLGIGNKQIQLKNSSTNGTFNINQFHFIKKSSFLFAHPSSTSRSSTLMSESILQKCHHMMTLKAASHPVKPISLPIISHSSISVIHVFTSFTDRQSALFIFILPHCSVTL